MGSLSLHSPVGDLTVHSDGTAIVALDWGWGSHQDPDPVTLEAKRQLEEYFDGRRKDFDIPVDPYGTSFQKAVWAAMMRIPYGATRSYGDVAKELNSVARAVGQACGRNPIPILIPCQRITGANGVPGGFSGGEGPETKIQLLRLEGALL